MKRYEKFVYEDERGITFEVKAKEGITIEASEGTSGELNIRALNIANSKFYSEDYANPVVPEGYEHICGEWNNGFVIERCSDGSQFVWIPVGYLDSNGTLDGFSFTEKFGRRNYRNDEFSVRGYHETLRGELALQVQSVRKYGGFYISRYKISKSAAGEPQSVKRAMPWVNINCRNANKVASSIEDNKAVKSHLTFGAEYDSVLEWFIKSNARTCSEIAENSTNWDTKNPPRRVVETGSREERYTNNIYDFGGDVAEFTQEEHNDSNHVVRGGTFYGDNFSVALRKSDYLYNCYYRTGFRATLCIK